VRALVDKNQNHGFYAVHFDSAALPSGVYFYELQTEQFMQRKKMLILR